jgi:hypothetical protein
MSRSVTFGGITQFRPGGITRINAAALAQIGLDSNGIVALIGEADGGIGAPGEVHTIDDPALASEYFKSGPLADAIRTAFDPSVDPRIPGGAFRCLCVRANQSTQATLTLYGRESVGSVAAASTDTVIQVTGGGMTVDEYVGNVLRISGEDRAIASNTTTAITVSTAFSAAPAAATVLEILAPSVVITSKKYGVEANGTKFEWEPGITLGGAWTNIFGTVSQTSEDVGDKSYLQVEYVGQSARVAQPDVGPAASAGPGSTTTLEDTGAAFAMPSGLTDFFILADTADNLTVNNFRKIASNTAIEITVTNAFTQNPWAAGGTNYSIRNGQILTFGATGGLDSGATTAWTSTTVTMHATDLDVALNELANMVLVITGGTGAGQRRTITGNTAGIASVITVDEAWTTTPDATSDFEVRYVTEALASVTGSSGVASAFGTTVAADGAASAADLAITITSKTTLEDLATEINANANYVATIPGGINNQILANTLDFDLGATDVELRNDKATVTTQPTPTLAYTVPWDNNFKRNVAQLVDDVNDKAEYVTIARATSGGTGTGGGRPEWSGTGTVGTVGDSAVLLTGAVRGVSTNTNWQAAFDLLIIERHNFIVPLIVEDLSEQGLSSTATWESVAAQLSSHVDAANGIAKNECGGLIGFKGTKTELLAAGANLNNADIQISSQTLRVLDVDGNLATQDEWVMSVVAAGMRAGAPEVGEPLTHKFIKTFALDQDSSWDPRDRTDANQLIAGGILFAEFIEGKGTRFVRDLTTHIQDDNLAYSEGSTRDAVRYTAYGLRTTLEDKFTGVKATPANAASIKDTAVAYLEALNADNIIVTSLNDADEIVPGFENLRVTISGDIATIKVMIYPAVGINFQLNDIFLQLPRQAA